MSFEREKKMSWENLSEVDNLQQFKAHNNKNNSYSRNPKQH